MRVMFDTQPPLFDPTDLRAAQWPFASLELYAYDTIMIDPPWDYENWSAKGEAKGPRAQYKTMSDTAIRALPVGDLAAPDCLLWLWATSPKLDLAMDCLRGWGFTFKTAGAWNKCKWGNGYIWRSVCEPVLIGASGQPRIRGKDLPNLFVETSRGHSRKPDVAYAMAERMMPSARRRADVFSRQTRPGWEACGDEVGKFDGEAA